jgi:hypothetical protein
MQRLSTMSATLALPSICAQSWPQQFKQRRYPWVLPKEKRMTIAAGFRVQDGKLLCSDSLYTDGTRAAKSETDPLQQFAY